LYFQGRVALVTGAAGGIGRALCFQLGRQGARLGLVDRNGPGLEGLRGELKAAGIFSAAAVADVRVRDQTRAAVEAVAEELGSVDILVAGAGVCGLAAVDDLKVPHLEEILQVNYLGAVYAIEAVLPGMLERGSGQIVGIASLAAVRAIPFEGAYCASKAALATYLESLRPPLARRGVAVTTVFPGFVRTPLLDDLLTTSGAKAPPGVMEVEPVAAKIVSAIRKRSRVSCFPRSTSWLAHGSRWLPPAVYDWVMTRVAARIPMPY
jgi:NAD(P)-dependent dehydrogenase (short-subunit alcohol dehydrogenase family)